MRWPIEAASTPYPPLAHILESPMAFFKLAEDGSVRFAAGKYTGKSINEIAISDPKYLRWAWRDCTLGVSLDLFEAVNKAMIVNGIPFTAPRKKKT